MQITPSHEDMRPGSPRVSSRRNTAEPHPHITPAVPAEDPAALELAIELIEMRYQQYCARMEMEVLFTEGELNCL